MAAGFTEKYMASSRKRKRKRVDESELSEQERLRRQRQRELRVLALQARAEGREYNPHKCKARVYRSDNVDKPLRPSQVKKQGRSAHADFQVVLIPIFWNQRDSEKRAVLSLSEEASELLGAAGISNRVDGTGSDYTPGQRMRYWEEQGVKVRLELGPQDAQLHRCIVARSQSTAGSVAYKVTRKIGPELVSQVTDFLAMADADVPKGDHVKQRKMIESRVAKPHLQDDDRQSDDEGHTSPSPQAAKACSASKQHGDDLDDDFQGVLDVPDVDEALTEEDKRRVCKAKKKRQ